MMFVFVFLMVGVSAAENESAFLDGEKFYTDNFYIFLGLLGFALIVVGIFVWLWIRGPVDKWKKK